MKKIILLIAIIFAANIGLKAQKDENKGSNSTANTISQPHEIKFNALYLLLGNVEVTYEHLINDYSSYGIMGNVNVDNNVIMNMNYMFLPYFRLYSGDNANGGFFEAGLAFYNQKVDSHNPTTWTSNTVNQASFGPSLSLGSKTVYGNNFTLECLFGVCRNYSGSTDGGSLIVPRFGITLGKRF